MKGLLALIVVSSGVAHAGELDDIKRVPMKPVDTVVVLDKGKQPRTVAYHFMAGSKRTMHATSMKTVKAIALGESQEAPQEESSEDSTYEAKAVSPDGTMTIVVKSGPRSATFEITAQGKARIDVNTTDPAASLLVAAMNASPVLLPGEPVGVGARWQAFSSVDMMGIKTDTVTQTTLTKIDGDKIYLHMVQDLRIDALGIAAKMGMTIVKITLSNNQNVADVILDLGSPALLAQSVLISVLEIRGTSGNKPLELEFLKRMMNHDKTSAAPATGLAGTWTRTWAGDTDSMVFRADGTGDSVSSKQKFRWRAETDKLVFPGEAGKSDVEVEMTLVGDVMVLRKKDKDARQQLWRRK